MAEKRRLEGRKPSIASDADRADAVTPGTLLRDARLQYQDGGRQPSTQVRVLLLAGERKLAAQPRNGWMRWFSMQPQLDHVEQLTDAMRRRAVTVGGALAASGSAGDAPKAWSLATC